MREILIPCAAALLGLGTATAVNEAVVIPSHTEPLRLERDRLGAENLVLKAEADAARRRELHRRYCPPPGPADGPKIPAVFPPLPTE